MYNALSSLIDVILVTYYFAFIVASYINFI